MNCISYYLKQWQYPVGVGERCKPLVLHPEILLTNVLSPITGMFLLAQSPIQTLGWYRPNYLEKG